MQFILLDSKSSASVERNWLELTEALDAKLQKNMVRTWPDWRTVPEGHVIEHVRDGSAAHV